MSWLSGLAGKAENLLNNLDSSAATALSHSPSSSTSSVRPTTPILEDTSDIMTKSDTFVTRPPSTASSVNKKSSSVILTKSSSSSSLTRISTTATTSAAKVSSRDKDAELLEMLNSNRSFDQLLQPGESSTVSKVEAPVVVSSVESQSPASSSFVVAGGNGKSHTHSRQSSVTSSFSKVSTSDVTPRPIEATLVDSATLPDDSKPPAELENKLLRSEISSLNQEVSSLLKRNQASQESQRRLQVELDKTKKQVTDSEDKVREGMTREQELEDLVSVRNSEIRAFQNKIEEMQIAHDNLRGQIQHLQAENDNVRSDSSLSAGYQQAAFQELQLKMQQSEHQLAQERSTVSSLQSDLLRLRQEIDHEKLLNSEMNREQEKKLLDEKRRYEAVTTELDSMQRKYSHLSTELRDYKEKATKTLQMKDKMIASLKGEGGASTVSPHLSEADLSAELEALKQEREILREEIQRSKMRAESLQCDIEDLEMQMQSENETFRRNIASLESHLEREKSNRLASEEEVSMLRRESSFLQEKNVKERSDLAQRLSGKEQEIEGLRRQIALKAASSDGQAELEARVRSLTENLIQRQSALESSNTECSSLRLMVEQLECQLRERSHVSALVHGDPLHSQNQHTTAVSVPYQPPDYIRIHMQDPPYAQHVKRAVGSLDKAGVRLGVFLRRYPVARLFFLVYICLLHFWVVIVLLTYQPEIHTSLHDTASGPVARGLPKPPST